MKSQEYDCVLQPCPCCGNKCITSLGEYEICDNCGWEDDPVQSANPDYAGGANKESLNAAKRRVAASQAES